MIQLTRLRHDHPFYVNPDLIERVDGHVDTIVRLTNGTEFVVNESGEEIVRRTAEFRARVIALAGIIQQTMPRSESTGARYDDTATTPAGEIASASTTIDVRHDDRDDDEQEASA